MSLVGWLLRNWEPARSARCTSCGKRALGVLNDSDSVVCERCGNHWNLVPQDREITENLREGRSREDDGEKKITDEELEDVREIYDPRKDDDIDVGDGMDMSISRVDVEWLANRLRRERDGVLARSEPTELAEANQRGIALGMDYAANEIMEMLDKDREGEYGWSPEDGAGYIPTEEGGSGRDQ